jgi:hypothetical protein
VVINYWFVVKLFTLELLSFSLIFPLHPLRFFCLRVVAAGNGAKGDVDQQEHYHYYP